MDEHAILFAILLGKLTNRFEKGLTFNIADRATDLSDDHINIVAANALDALLDFISDMRDDLNRLSQKFTSALLFNHAQIYLSGGVIGFS